MPEKRFGIESNNGKCEMEGNQRFLENQFPFFVDIHSIGLLSTSLLSTMALLLLLWIPTQAQPVGTG
jgi:hypothetical protein